MNEQQSDELKMLTSDEKTKIISLINEARFHGCAGADTPYHMLKRCLDHINEQDLALTAERKEHKLVARQKAEFERRLNAMCGGGYSDLAKGPDGRKLE